MTMTSAYKNIYLISSAEAYRSPEEICVLMDEEESWVMFVDETELAVRNVICFITTLWSFNV